MGLCMDSSDWLQVFGGHHDHEIGMDSSSSPSGDMMTCTTRPLMERRLRPHHDQIIKCPRCDSTHTKFCYYNNYSLSQPRYFCKTCRRYWTKGGTLRNIPVGGGCRKNKRAVIKRSNDQPHLNPNHPNFLTQTTGTDLQLSFPDVGNSLFHSNLMEMNYSSMSVGDNLQGLWSTYDGSYGPLMDTSQRFMLTFEGSDDSNAFEMKPDSKVLSLEWKDHGCSENGNGLRSWQTEIDSYGSSATAPLI